MAQQKNMLLALNRGIVSALGLARIDSDRVKYGAQTQTNIVPRVLGSAMLRPGLEYINSTRSDNLAILEPFVFSVDDTAMLEFTEVSSVGDIRVLIDDVILTRPTVTAAITNGSFVTDLTGWTDSDESGATSNWTDAGSAFFGYMDLKGDGLNAAIREQQVTVNETGIEHALSIGVIRGPVTLRVGSTAGGEDYIAETALGTGTHSLAFTPTGDFHIHLSSRLKYTVRLNGCLLESDNEVFFGTNYGIGELGDLRFAQSGDIIFIASNGKKTKKIERRGTRSWSYVDYESIGPFRAINITDITMAPSAIEGDITITASKDFFRSTHVGATIRIASIGQDVRANISAEDNFTDPIKVTGAGDARIFNVVISGTFTATVTIQYSVGEPGSWVDLATTYAVPTTTTIDDGLDNQIVYYRIGVKSGDFTSDTAVVKLTIPSGSITGIARIHGYTNATAVTGRVIRAFGGTDPSKDWWESEWSDYRGWPTAVAFHEGRLGLSGKDKIWLSESDEYYNFDDETVGDSGPINRRIGFGPIQAIHWMMSIGRLLMGTAQNSANVAPALMDGNSPIAARSSSFDEPLTPTNFNLKQVDPVGAFVDRSRTRLYTLQFDGDDYRPADQTILAPDLNAVGIAYIVVQMKPDIRIHCVRTDGTVGMLVFDRGENVVAWIEIETDGYVRHVSVLPGDVEDQVYYVVERTINSATKHYIEKWALESECQGGTLNKQADSFYLYSGASVTTITGLSHLEGETVYVWANGKNLGSYVVASAEITVSEAVTDAVIGKTYTGQFKGVKLGALFEGGLNKRRRIAGLGLVMHNTHHQGVQYGPSFTELYDLPAVLDNQTVVADTVFEDFEYDIFSAGGGWSNDSRLCLQMTAPNPATIQAVSLVVDD